MGYGKVMGPDGTAIFFWIREFDGRSDGMGPYKVVPPPSDVNVGL